MDLALSLNESEPNKTVEEEKIVSMTSFPAFHRPGNVSQDTYINQRQIRIRNMSESYTKK